MNNLETVSARVRELVPRLMKSSVGCELVCIKDRAGFKGHDVGDRVRVVSTEGGRLFVDQFVLWGKKSQGTFKWIYGRTIDDFKIIGHPITRDDILEALSEFNPKFIWAWDSGGYLIQWCVNKKKFTRFLNSPKFPIGKPLSEQPQETIDFLADILK